MNKDLFSLREGEIFQTLKALSRCNFVVIGGYAVNAYTLPRFSVDCDIVVKENHELQKIEKILLSREYYHKKSPAERQYLGSFRRYEKRLDHNFTVSMDVLVKQVTDRTTGVLFEADWIAEHSSIKPLKGKTITEELKLRIIDIDALLVMKIISCRSTDIRDVFMMLPKAKSQEWIKSEVSARYDFDDRIAKIVDKVISKQFKDGLAGVYGYFDAKVFEKHKKALFSLKEVALL